MSFTFDQMMSGEGLPEQNVRKAATVRRDAPGAVGAVSRAMQEHLRSTALERFLEIYGKEADTIEAAEKDGEFACMAYRVQP